MVDIISIKKYCFWDSNIAFEIDMSIKTDILGQLTHHVYVIFFKRIERKYTCPLSCGIWFNIDNSFACDKGIIFVFVETTTHSTDFIMTTSAG